MEVSHNNEGLNFKKWLVNECYRMKERKQKISNDTCPQKNRAEPKGYAGGQTFIWITENNITDTEYGIN